MTAVIILMDILIYSLIDLLKIVLINFTKIIR